MLLWLAVVLCYGGWRFWAVCVGFGDLWFLSLGLILWLSCWFVDGAGSFLGMVCRFFDFLDFGVGAIYLFTFAGLVMGFVRRLWFRADFFAIFVIWWVLLGLRESGTFQLVAGL